MKLDSTDFELFDVPPRFEQKRDSLDARWRALQADVHPDRYASQGAAAQRAALQWSVRVNEAYQRLKDPLRRAAYLCELNGAPIDAENNTAMPGAFLMQQMDWHEALDDARAAPEVEVLAGEVAAHRHGALAELAATLDDRRDFHAAAQQVRALMFVERFSADIEARLQALEGLEP